MLLLISGLKMMKADSCTCADTNAATPYFGIYLFFPSVFY